MAAFCVKGDITIACLPVAGKPRGFCMLSSSSVHVVTAKATPKLEKPAQKSALKTRLSDKSEKGSKKTRVPVKEDTESKQRTDEAKKIYLESLKNQFRLLIPDHPTLDPIMKAKMMEKLNMDTQVSATEMTVSESSEHTEIETMASEGTDNSQESDDEELNLDCDETEALDDATEMFLPPGVVASKEKPLRRLPGSNIFLSPYAKGSRIKQAEFVKSSPCVAECPSVKLPEFAMVGRSNVGKSSLINALVQRKDLAQTSKRPGKTQLINHFIINQSWYLVDLPGFGYAKVPADVRTSWDGFTKEFFLHSKSLVCVMLLVDGSIPPQKIDLEYAAWLRENKVPLTIVFTKCDRKKKKKSGGKKPEENVKAFLSLLKEQFGQLPPWIMTSCVTNQGKDALLMHMGQLRHYWNS